METLQTSRPPAASPPAARPSATSLAGSPAPEARPTSPGSLAPDPVTATPAFVITPTVVTATAPPEVIPAATLPALNLPTAPARSNEDRWRAQQQDRLVFDGLVPFFTTGSELWWYDPVNQQHVILGRITGDFAAQAQFVLHGQGLPALEVPYEVNVSYGLTALSPALLERIRVAGYESGWIETYLFLTPNVATR